MAESSKQQLPAIGFLSYNHFDNQYENDRIVNMVRMLAQSVRFRTGNSFVVFIDKDDIGWGENWKCRIQEGMDSAAFLITIMTPSYFKSTECLNEFLRFREREEELEREDLILPVYYAPCDEIENPSLCVLSSYWAEVMSMRQYSDFREIRKVGENTIAVRKALENLACDIKERLRTFQAPRISKNTPLDLGTLEESVIRDDSSKSAKLSDKSDIAPDCSLNQVTYDTEWTTWSSGSGTKPSSLVVNRNDASCFNTITEALASSIPGSTILVHPGIYEENLEIVHRVKIVGLKEKGTVTIIAQNTVISIYSPLVELENLVIQSDLIPGRYFASDSRCLIKLEGGKLKLSKCTLHNGYTGISCYPETRIKATDVFIKNLGLNGIECNGCTDVELNGVRVIICSGNGISIAQCDNASITNCEVSDCHGFGIYVHGDCELGHNNVFSNMREDIKFETYDDLPF